MANKNLYNKAQKWAFNQLMKGIKVQQCTIEGYIWYCDMYRAVAVPENQTHIVCEKSDAVFNSITNAIECATVPLRDTHVISSGGYGGRMLRVFCATGNVRVYVDAQYLKDIDRDADLMCSASNPRKGAVVAFIGNVPIAVIMPTRVEPDHCPDFVLNAAERSWDNAAAADSWT